MYGLTEMLTINNKNIYIFTSLGLKRSIGEIYFQLYILALTLLNVRGFMFRKKEIVVAIALATASTITAPAFGEIEEVIVTATKRSGHSGCCVSG
jgi:hypothetical protein